MASPPHQAKSGGADPETSQWASTGPVVNDAAAGPGRPTWLPVELGGELLVTASVAATPLQLPAPRGRLRSPTAFTGYLHHLTFCLHLLSSY